MSFEREILRRDLGVTASSIATDCEAYGMVHGCTTGCPVLISGECELQEAENKELYAEAMEEQ